MREWLSEGLVMRGEEGVRDAWSDGGEMFLRAFRMDHGAGRP